MASYHYFGEPLGIGGEKIVYKATCNETGELVVVKFLRKPFTAFEKLAFAKECTRIEAAQGIGVARFIDKNLDWDPPFYVEEYFPEGNLAQVLIGQFQSGRAIPLVTALRWTRRVLEHLHRLHLANLIHRDVKPQNIMVRGGDLVLIDFGIGRTLDRPTMLQTQAFKGTPAYAAPEQRYGQRVDRRVDLYAVGVMLHQMLTGQLGAYNYIAYNARRDVATILSRFLALVPDHRYRNAVEAINAIDTILRQLQAFAPGP